MVDLVHHRKFVAYPKNRIFVSSLNFFQTWCNNFPCAVKFPSKFCNLPTCIISSQAFGTTCMTSKALSRVSVLSLARSVNLSTSLSSNWYFIIRWTGLMRRSGSATLWPSFCLISMKNWKFLISFYKFPIFLNFWKFFKCL